MRPQGWLPGSPHHEAAVPYSLSLSQPVAHALCPVALAKTSVVAISVAFPVQRAWAGKTPLLLTLYPRTPTKPPFYSGQIIPHTLVLNELATPLA